jgi:hypothetical protein
LDETKTLRRELNPFRKAKYAPSPSIPHPPLILEVTLDQRKLKSYEKLCLVSSRTEKGWESVLPWMCGGLFSLDIVLERWCIELITPTISNAPVLPVVDKRTIVLFRRLFTHCRLLPVYRLKKRLSKLSPNASLGVAVRVAEGEKKDNGVQVPCVEGQTRETVSEEVSFGRVDTPIGYPN